MLVSTSWKVSFAVRPSNRLISSGSSTPGSCTRTRSAPCRWITGSFVPSGSIRRRIISIDCSMVWLCRSISPCSVKARRKAVPSAAMLTAGPNSAKIARAALSSSGLRMEMLTAPSRTAKPLNRRLFCRNSRRTVSAMPSRRSLTTTSISTRNSKCEPPCKSRPRLIF